jgi:hypothetical protein
MGDQEQSGTEVDLGEGVRLTGVDLPSFKCAACMQNGFTILDGGGSLTTAIHLYRDADPLPKKFSETVMVACTNCGHTMTFVKLFLRNYVQARRLSGASQ